MDKNKLIVIILATALAFFITYLFLHNSDNKNNKNLKQENIQENQLTQDEINKEKEDLLQLTEEEKSRPALDPIPTEEVKQDIIKINKNIENHKKQPKTPKKQETLKINNNINTTSVETKLEETNNINNQEEENGVIVPVSYTSKNTYKYVYTPSKFNK